VSSPRPRDPSTDSGNEVSCDCCCRDSLSAGIPELDAGQLKSFQRAGE
jgi:hypothetical protein